MISRKYMYLAAVIIVAVLLYFFYPEEKNLNGAGTPENQFIEPEIRPRHDIESETREENSNIRIIP